MLYIYIMTVLNVSVFTSGPACLYILKYIWATLCDVNKYIRLYGFMFVVKSSNIIYYVYNQ